MALSQSEIISAELEELRRVCESSIPGSKLIACVPQSIRVEVARSSFKKLTICLTYPNEYPAYHVLIELKSKTIGQKLLDGLVKVSEEEAKKFEGKPHCLQIIKFIDQFLEENPLVCCSDEISSIRALLDTEAGDKLKLSQKTSSISIHVIRGKYYFKAKIILPNDYPEKQVSIESPDCNFPRVFKVWFVEQAREIARRCVQPPLKPKPKEPPFEPRPSLRPILKFLVDHVKRYPNELCKACNKRCFPEDPATAVHNENAAAHVERVYCSHCYHHDCLILYMKSPPFKGVKKCHTCKQSIYHEKWKVTPELAEARWAHEQAKNRELGEVVDFVEDWKS